MNPLSLRLTTAVLSVLLLAFHPQTVVGFANEKPTAKQAAFFSSSYRTSKLLQSSRVLPSEEISTSSTIVKAIHNLQERFTEYQHVRKQRKLGREASLLASYCSDKNSMVQGFVPVVKEFLHKPNKKLLQSHVMAHQQAQYDHLVHAYHEQALSKRVMKSSSSTTDAAIGPLSIGQCLVQTRKEAKDARLAAKYAAIESLEDRAFQICKDLGMI
ncbi:unnamed protein product [Cylindrotheca closterium]|uniref:Uncharacterized protein n=1 Tax=Cylindrotheca closterium TaxID=2856 RepID=A0AAD2PY43_9STRA|nr:unnamed protein product [Cylindrotheca closterium]